MKFLIVGLKGGSQFKRLKEEAEKLGHELLGCKSSDLVIKSGGGEFSAFIQETSLTDFDLIYLCAGIESGKRYEWYTAADYIKSNFKTKIVNEMVVNPTQKYYPIQTWFYLKQFENTVPQPKTYSVFGGENLKNIVEDLGFPLIVKLSETHQGKGIFLVNSLQETEDLITKHPGQTYLLRQFIENDGDIRIFVVGKNAIGAMMRTPTVAGEFRSNISVGGKGEVFDLATNPAIKSLAEKAANIAGVEVAGVDIMLSKNDNKPYVLEVNVGPQFGGFEKYTNINAAENIIKYFISKVGGTI